MLKDTFERIVEAVVEACREVYGEQLVALALFGSVARGTMRPESDIDLLVIVDPLPAGRLARKRMAALHAPIAERTYPDVFGNAG